MNINEVKILIEAFYNGETSATEEKALLQYFQSDHVAEELLDERDIFLQLQKVQPAKVPPTLEAKLDTLINNLAEKELKQVSRKSKKNRKQLWVTIGGVAASLTLLFSIGYYVNSQNNNSGTTQAYRHMPDTYSDPDRAYEEAEKALIMVSSNLNKGFEQISVVSVNIDRTKERLDKSINRKKDRNI